MPALRGHHLICLHFFGGEGYNQEFIKNLKDVLKSAVERGIKINVGPDEVCIKCPYMKGKKCNYNEHADDEIREMDDKALDMLKLSEGMLVGWNTLKEKIPGIFEAWYTAYCSGCGWKRACEKNPSYRKLRGSMT